MTTTDYQNNKDFALNASAKAGNYADYFEATKASVDYYVDKGRCAKGLALELPGAYRSAAYFKAFNTYKALHKAYVDQGVAVRKDPAVYGFNGSRG